MRKQDLDPHRITEQTFETVRLDEFAQMPSRRHCIFMFDLGLDPDFYADSMNIPDPETYNVVEIEVTNGVANGKSDDSERFRLLVGKKLSEKGFTIVEKADDADAILKGALATQLAQGTTKARVSVYLKSLNGQSLWSEDYGVRFVLGSHRDSIKLRAEDVANGLHDAWKKSAKAAGIKTNK